jgi:hypothetical protein
MSRGQVMTESTLDYQKVRRIQFGLLDPKQIVRNLFIFDLYLILLSYSKLCQ